jgi:hypothetical protein
MMCPVCHKRMKTHVNHHYLHPKNKYKSNYTIKVHRGCERAYHLYFSQNCQGRCETRACRYAKVCYKHGRW